MITGKMFKLRTGIIFESYLKNPVKNGLLKSRNLSEEKKLPEHKQSVTSVRKSKQ